MGVALFGLLVAATLGVSLVGALTGTPIPFSPLLLTDLHAGFGLIGWILLLLVAVAYQVVPMFQVTPEYPRWMRRSFSFGVSAFLIVWGVASVAQPEAAWIRYGLMLPLAACAGLFAVITLRLQRQRRRKVPDTTLAFWRVGLAALLAAILLWVTLPLIASSEWRDEAVLLLGTLLIAGAALMLLNGMLYKIVPFLSWFHLQHRQMQLLAMTVQVPNMKELIPDARANSQLGFAIVALGLTLLATLLPAWFARPAGLAWITSFGMLSFNLAGAAQRYRRTAAELLQSPMKMP